MAQIRPTELTTVQAAAAVIAGVQFNGSPLAAKIVPRWILALSVGEAVTHLAPKNGANLLPINAWVMTTASWTPAKVKSDTGNTQTPKSVNLFSDIFSNPDAVVADEALERDYKISVSGSLKIWQLVQYRQGDDDDNSERDCMMQRQAVIDEMTKHPRLGLNWFDFEHDEIKFPALAVLPFNGSLIHIAQGNLPFTFSYVVKAA